MQQTTYNMQQKTYNMQQTADCMPQKTLHDVRFALSVARCMLPDTRASAGLLQLVHLVLGLLQALRVVGTVLLQPPDYLAPFSRRISLPHEIDNMHTTDNMLQRTTACRAAEAGRSP